MATVIIITPPPTRPKSVEHASPAPLVLDVENTEGMSVPEILRAAADQLDAAE